MIGTPSLYRLGADVYKDTMPDPFDGPGEPEVVYEDPGLAAVYKPRRMHSAPGAGGGGLCAWVFERYPEAAAVRAPAGRAATRRREPEGGLLHRLDFETSGLVVFARDDETFASLLAQQDEGLFLKEYLARSSSGVEDGPAGSRPPRGVPLGIDGVAWASARDRRDAEGMAALIRSSRAAGAEPRIECSFRAYGPGSAAVACLGAAAGAAYRADLLDARASEGRIELTLGLARGFRHQLRAQLAWIGLPMDGDPLYGGVPADRLYLHAARVAFVHPRSGSPLVIGPGGPEPASSGAMGAFASLHFRANSGRL
jgi:23S rRNA-/tRNA-specific pseudouridylate synthase